jgi:VanZ family protein
VSLALRSFRRPRLWLAVWYALLALTLLACLAPLPSVRVPPLLPHLDKLEHLLGYACLSAYAAMLFATPRAAAVAALFLMGYGLLIEALQAQLPWRSADPVDALANALGVALGMLVFATPAARGLQRLDARLA